MDLNHLHLHVRDVARSREYYEQWFGFSERVRHGEILFLRNGDGFDLALAPAETSGAFPSWFHFGFRLESPEDVRALHARMAEAGAVVRPLLDEADLVSFRSADPDGHSIEIYWE